MHALHVGLLACTACITCINMTLNTILKFRCTNELGTLNFGCRTNYPKCGVIDK